MQGERHINVELKPHLHAGLDEEENVRREDR